MSTPPPQEHVAALRVFQPPAQQHSYHSIPANYGNVVSYAQARGPTSVQGIGNYSLSHSPYNFRDHGLDGFAEPVDPYAPFDSPTAPEHLFQQHPRSPMLRNSMQPRSAPPSTVMPSAVPSRDAFRTPSPTLEANRTAHEASPQRANMQQAPQLTMGMPRPITQSRAPLPIVEDPGALRCTDFVAKLWFLLDRPEYSAHIRWCSNGETFIFYPTPEFATEVLARLFKHSNVASFVRQLNLYGFQRISHLELLEEPHDGGDGINSAPASVQAFEQVPSVPASGFAHPLFIRGRPHNLSQIRPKPSPSRSRKSTGGTKRKARVIPDDEDEDEEYGSSTNRRRLG